MQKWEYCVVGPINMISGPKGAKLMGQSILKAIAGDYADWTGVIPPDATPHYLAQLGNDGWELVGCGNDGDKHVLYFKRPVLDK